MFRCFVPIFSKAPAPLKKWLQKFQSTSLPFLILDEKYAIENLNKQLTNLPILALPPPGDQYTVDTDGLDSKVGYVILQQQADGTSRPIGFCSRTLTDAEQNLETTHKVFLVVVWVVLLL